MLSHIKCTSLRRTVIIVAFVPLCALEIALQMALAAIETLRDLPTAVASAWRG